MVKIIKKSTSKINCNLNSENKSRRRRRKFMQRNQKGSTKFKNEHQKHSSYHPGSSTLPSFCDPDRSEEDYIPLTSDNHLHRSSSVLDVSSVDELVECITIEENSTDNSSELKNAFEKRQEQFQPYSSSTSLKQQCELFQENDDNSENRKQFEDDIKVLQDGIQSQINHGRRHRTNSDFYFNAIKRLNKNCYIKQLLQEKRELDKEFRNIKKKLNRKCDLIFKEISIMQSVYGTIKQLIKFSMHQRKVISSRARWLACRKNEVSKRGRNRIGISTSDDTTFLPEESITSQQHMSDQEVKERKVSTNTSFLPEEFSINQLQVPDEVVFGNNLFDTEVSSVIQSEVIEEKMISDNPSLVLRDQELSDAKEKAFVLLEQLKGTQDELQKVRNEMNEQMNIIQQNADCEQKKMKVQLSEIRAMLKEKLGSSNQISNIMENSVQGVTCQSILFDIRWLVEECAHLKGDETTRKNTDSTAITSDGLKVTENEVHLVILIAFFLKVIPFSVSTEFIHTYLKNIDNAISLQFVKSLLNKFPTVFKGESAAAGSLEKTWCYLNLNPIITI